MPHLTLEHTRNLVAFDAKALLWQLNAALVASGHFEEIDVKSRAVPLDTFAVGTEPSLERAFVHVRLAILSGRPEAVKRELSEQLLAVLQTGTAWPAGLHVQLCVEVQEIDRPSYAKASIVPSTGPLLA